MGDVGVAGAAFAGPPADPRRGERLKQGRPRLAGVKRCELSGRIEQHRGCLRGLVQRIADGPLNTLGRGALNWIVQLAGPTVQHPLTPPPPPTPRFRPTAPPNPPQPRPA